MSDSAVPPWHPYRLPRRLRWQALGHSGVTVWLTGLPGAGKSTIAFGLERLLMLGRRPACALDAEVLDRGINADLGSDVCDEAERARRIAELAVLLSDAGLAVLVAIVSPREADRAWARDLHEREWLTFLEVHVSTPLEVCEARDPKGRYALARQARLGGMVGVQVRYEPPRDPEFEIDTSGLSPSAAVAEVVRALGLDFG